MSDASTNRVNARRWAGSQVWALASMAAAALLLLAIAGWHAPRSLPSATPGSAGVLDGDGDGDGAAAAVEADAPSRAPTRHATPRPAPKQTVAQLIGLDAAEARLGKNTPTGRGVRAGHVEGDPGDYMPNRADRALQGVDITPRSGPSKSSGHATATCKIIYGPAGLAPGISQVDMFTARHWLSAGYLRAGSPLPPRSSDLRLFSHSWVGPEYSPFAQSVLRRLDYVIDERDVIAVVGVNNEAEKPVPALLASAYNAIAVGQWAGDSSGGYTTIEGEGRCKPDLVAPHALTSFSTPVVAAMAARLLETADHMPDSRAARSEVIKAVLLAGAVKPPGWKPAAGKALDEHYGAGRVHLDNSLRVLSAGAAPGRSPVGPLGWNFEPMLRGAQVDYVFEAAHATGPVSLMLIWHRRIDGRAVEDLISGEPRWLDTPRLADFDLSVVRRGEGDGGERRAAEHVVAESAGAVDNLEHVYVRTLPAGSYRFHIRRKDALNEAWDYAFAWRIEPAP